MTVSTATLVPAPGGVLLKSDLSLPATACGVVVVTYGGGSNRHCLANRATVNAFTGAGLATLCPDLLTPEEQAQDQTSARYRYNISLLSQRLASAVDGLHRQPDTAGLPVELFGSGTSAAVALRVAAEKPDRVCAVVSWRGRPDLVDPAVLAHVAVPTLLLVRADERFLLLRNLAVLERLRSPAELVVEEPEKAMARAATWMRSHCTLGLPQDSLPLV